MKNKSILNKIVLLIIISILGMTNIIYAYGNDYTGIGGTNGETYSNEEGHKYVITAEETGTDIVINVNGEIKTIRFGEGEGVPGTVYQYYQYTAKPGEPNAPPSYRYDTTPEAMATLAAFLGFSEDVCNAIRSENANVLIDLSPYVAIRDTTTNKIYRMNIKDAVAAGWGEEAWVGGYITDVYNILMEETDYTLGHVQHSMVPKGILIDEPEIIPEDPGTPPTTTTEYGEENDRLSITPGFAPPKDPHGSGSITNSDFGVPSNPIPVSEELNVTACTNAVGLVKNLGKYTVSYKSYTYKFEVSWENKEYYTYDAEEYEYDETGKLIIDKKTGKAKTKKVKKVGTRTVSSGTVSDTKELSGTATFIKILDSTDYYKLNSVTINNEPVLSHTFSFNQGIAFSEEIFSGSDLDRVKHTNPSDKMTATVTSFSGDAESIAQTKLKNMLKSASVFDFWSSPTEDKLGSSYGLIKNNGAITIAERCESAGEKIKNNVPNKSLDDGYSASGIHNFTSLKNGGTTSEYGFEVNSVRIHTPIYDQLTIESPSTNQVVQTHYDTKVNPGLNKNDENFKYVVTLGEKFEAKVNVAGLYRYYYYPEKTSKQMDLNVTKYIQDVVIECHVCNSNGIKYSWKQGQLKKEGNYFIHECTVPLTQVDDTSQIVKSYVYALNYSEERNGTEENIKNKPDDIYVLTQTKQVYIAGKIYDLEVRATDDPAWKLKQADKLNALPTGEKGDNSISTYNKGIKLGYRAYFDLKTLGVASKAIKLTARPKIYYVTQDGKIDKDVVLYYKTSATDYKELYLKDINISMIMDATRGAEFNPDFSDEKLYMLQNNLDINYTQKLYIGGAHEMKLGKNNSTATKYNNKYAYPIENSRRWYGEFYLPASTVVAEKGATISQIARGEKVKKTGYLVVTFDDIVSTLDEAGNGVYLQYKMSRNANGTLNSVDNSQLVKEKAGKNQIILPNGKIFNIYKKTDAPIIVYDVALRANNDYEQTGTH